MTLFFAFFSILALFRFFFLIVFEKLSVFIYGLGIKGVFFRELDVVGRE